MTAGAGHRKRTQFAGFDQRDGSAGVGDRHIDVASDHIVVRLRGTFVGDMHELGAGEFFERESTDTVVMSVVGHLDRARLGARFADHIIERLEAGVGTGHEHPIAARNEGYRADITWCVVRHFGAKQRREHHR